MSDTVLRERAARRQRLIVLAGVFIVLVACLIFAFSNTFYDRCTNGLDRSASGVVRAYLEAIAAGRLSTVENCWVREAYFSLDAGCSELCLARVLGRGFTVSAIQPGQLASVAGREQLSVDVRVRCPSGAEASASLVLDRVGGAVPWKHWRVMQSGAGGTAAQPWCQ